VQGPTASDPAVREHLTEIHAGDWAAYKYVDFDAAPVTAFEALAGSAAYGGVLEVHLDAPGGELIARSMVGRTGGWQQWATVRAPVTGARGVRAVYLVFQGSGDKFVIPKFDPERLFDLDRFRFVAG
jgi:hypothetical protein